MKNAARTLIIPAVLSAFYICSLIVILLCPIPAIATSARTPNLKFRVVALAEAGGIHRPFVDAAKVWLQKLASDRNFAIDYLENTDKIDDDSCRTTS